MGGTGQQCPSGRSSRKRKWPTQSTGQANDSLEKSQALPPAGSEGQGFALCRFGGRVR